MGVSDEILIVIQKADCGPDFAGFIDLTVSDSFGIKVSKELCYKSNWANNFNELMQLACRMYAFELFNEIYCERRTSVEYVHEAMGTIEVTREKSVNVYPYE